jgi:thiamine biosynthesis lipoprotein
MGTEFRICVFADASKKLTAPFDLRRELARIETINGWMSDWQEGTELSRVNREAAVRPVQVSPELFRLLEFAHEVSRVTDGAFDVSFNVFWGLYRFKKGEEREPTEAEINDRLPLLDYRKVQLNSGSRTVRFERSGIKIGLGAIGQGYAVDQVVRQLKEKYPAGYIDGSGDTIFWGKKPDGQDWVTALRDPRDHSKVVARIAATDVAITTAGDDERFFINEKGEHIHHIIDPKSGRPARASRQVTVLGNSALEADAFDTGAFVLGPKKGREVLEKRGLRGVFVTEAGVELTAGWAQERRDGQLWLRPAPMSPHPAVPAAGSR